ncbi:hypothetical protein BD779DRAFT_1546050 [Infundibulicybe gibba]|nr:hypothetical protein BD779DRAFT_1546050 [Infundibulicybe gibba]
MHIAWCCVIRLILAHPESNFQFRDWAPGVGLVGERGQARRGQESCVNRRPSNSEINGMDHCDANTIAYTASLVSRRSILYRLILDHPSLQSRHWASGARATSSPMPRHFTVYRLGTLK